jgi:hypothetical protein
LVEPIDTTGERHVDNTSEWHTNTIGEQPIDDLVAGVKQMVLGD